jgi:hypothetical protein
MCFFPDMMTQLFLGHNRVTWLFLPEFFGLFRCYKNCLEHLTRYFFLWYKGRGDRGNIDLPGSHTPNWIISVPDRRNTNGMVGPFIGCGDSIVILS